MVGGGMVSAAAFVAIAFNPAWQVQFVLFVVLGIGFYCLHGSIQVEASELSTAARGTAVSMHSLCFFMGHAAGPVLYSVGFAYLGAPPTVLLGGLVAMFIGLMCAHYLRRPGA